MNREEAENYIYESYNRVLPHQDYNFPDSKKRHPEYTRDYLSSLKKAPCVVVTGSKGKGSTANMIAVLLGQFLKVGLFTSPHMVRFNERIRIIDEQHHEDRTFESRKHSEGDHPDACEGILKGQISDEDFTAAVCSVKPHFDKLEETFAEDECISPIAIQCAAALTHFAKAETSVNILECGKGARFDDVNNVPHETAVIGPIFLEHTRELGETLEEIAENKSHVITGDVRTAYVAEQDSTVLDIISRRADSCGTRLMVYGRDFYAKDIHFSKDGMVFDVVINHDGIRLSLDNLTLPLLGFHQAKNCALALAVTIDLLSSFGLSISLQSSFRDALGTLSWPGRMEIIRKKPLTILDATINRASCRNVLDVLKALNIERVITVIGIPDDKDYLGVAEAMKSISQQIYLTGSGNPHYRFTKKQLDVLMDRGIEARWTAGTAEVMKLKTDIPIVILGTTSVVSEIEQLLHM